MPPRNTLHQPLPQARSALQAGEVLSGVLGSVEGVSVKPHERAGPEAVDVMVYASGNTWSRAARRKKRDAMETEEGTGAQSVQLVCRIRCEGDVGEVVMHLDWVAGRDRGLFEGFTSHVQRRVVAMLAEGKGGPGGEA